MTISRTDLLGIRLISVVVTGGQLPQQVPAGKAAGVLIARECGAVVTDSDGSPFSLTAAHAIAASPAIAPLLLDLIASAW